MANAATTGHAKTVLVFGQEADAVGVVSAIVVRPLDGFLPGAPRQERRRGRRTPSRRSGRLSFRGPATFDDSVRRHLAEVILPVVDDILDALDVLPGGFEISLVNLSAASAANIGLRISGFSADLAVLVALLSAALQLPVAADVVCTGHVASRDGAIRMVEQIPAKLAAAIADPSTTTFIHPAVNADASCAALSRGEERRAAEAILGAGGQIRTVAVTHAVEVVQAVFAEEDVIESSLRQGFFSAAGHAGSGGGLAGVAQALAADLENRFWATVERLLISEESDRARELLLARARFEIARRTYPANLGRTLLQLLRSLPPALRRFKVRYPLLPAQVCIALSQFAGPADHDDVGLLHAAAAGSPACVEANPAQVAARSTAATAGKDDATLDALLAEIDGTVLARTIGLPIDSARASYAMDTILTDSYDVAKDTLTAFYLHLLRHTRGVAGTVDQRQVEAEAVDLLARTFARKGGPDAAFAEIRDGIQGGLRFVLDAMTGQFKTEQQHRHVEWALRSALDPLDWEARVALMAALLERLGPHLPEEIRSQPPERYARHYQNLVRQYVDSVEKLKSFMRAI